METPKITDRVCSACRTERLWATDVFTDAAGWVEVTACPACDRMQCGICRGRHGRIFAPGPPSCPAPRA